MPLPDNNPHPPQLDEAPISMETATQMSADTAKEKSRWRAFWDFFVLFSGISTKSNLARTRRGPIQNRGLFLFRSRDKAR